MRILPLELTENLKRTIVMNGLVALTHGIDSFEEWTKNYSPDEDIFMRGEKKYIENFYKYINRVVKEGFEIFDPYERPLWVDYLIKQINSK